MKTPATARRLTPFYPIVPDADWIARLVPLGVRTIQLRIKDQPSDVIAEKIRQSLEVCRQHQCLLVVNDYWREAIAAGAEYVHLGQEDLASADVEAIRSTGLSVGISTHDSAELKTALANRADYVALGPIFETKLKVMPWRPQGLARLSQWRKRIGDIQLIAIGGLTPQRATQALHSGADAAAVITDFFVHPDPEARVKEWLAWERQQTAIGLSDPGS